MANSLLPELKKRLKGKVVVVGIGNTLRGDDGAGPELIRILKKHFSCNVKCEMFNEKTVTHYTSHITLFLMDVGEVPENYLGKIAEHRPDTIMLVDAVDFGSPPGSIRIIEKDALKEKGFCTHNASIKLIMEYLGTKTESIVFLLGVQPTKNFQTGSKLSEPVKQATRRMEQFLIRCMTWA